MSSTTSAPATATRVLRLRLKDKHAGVLAGLAREVNKRIKGVSSRVLRQEFPKLRSRIPSLWTNSYFVSTVGRAPLAVIKRYIENQKQVC